MHMQVWSDAHVAARTLLRSPGFSLTALLTLVVGMSATTLALTAVNAVLLKPLSVRAPDRVVGITTVGELAVLRNEPVGFRISLSISSGACWGNLPSTRTKATWYAKPNRLWGPRRRAISRRSASRKVASRIRLGRETSGSETGTVLSGTNARSGRTVQQHRRVHRGDRFLAGLREAPAPRRADERSSSAADRLVVSELLAARPDAGSDRDRPRRSLPRPASPSWAIKENIRIEGRRLST